VKCRDGRAVDVAVPGKRAVKVTCERVVAQCVYYLR
jgi:hypothetical protein